MECLSQGIDLPCETSSLHSQTDVHLRCSSFEELETFMHDWIDRGTQAHKFLSFRIFAIHPVPSCNGPFPGGGAAHTPAQ